MVQCIYTTMKCNEQNNYLIFQGHPARLNIKKFFSKFL